MNAWMGSQRSKRVTATSIHSFPVQVQVQRGHSTTQKATPTSLQICMVFWESHLMVQPTPSMVAIESAASRKCCVPVEGEYYPRRPKTLTSTHILLVTTHIWKDVLGTKCAESWQKIYRRWGSFVICGQLGTTLSWHCLCLGFASILNLSFSYRILY